MLFFLFGETRKRCERRGTNPATVNVSRNQKKSQTRHKRETPVFFFFSFSNVQCNFVLDYRGLLCVFFCVCFFSLLRYNPWQTNGEKKIRTGDCLFSAKRVRV